MWLLEPTEIIFKTFRFDTEKLNILIISKFENLVFSRMISDTKESLH